MSGILYRLDFASGKSYIGVTLQEWKARLRDHKRSAANGEPFLVYRAWRKYGPPHATILARVESSLLSAMERKAIAVFQTMKPGGYNMTSGGDESPTTNPEIAARVSASLLGRKHSPERVRKMVISLTGRSLSPEHRTAIAAGQKHLPRSEQIREQIKASHRARGRRYFFRGQLVCLQEAVELLQLPRGTVSQRLRSGLTLDQIAAIGSQRPPNRTIGRPRPPEVRMKISLNSGSRRPEVRAKISASLTGKRHSVESRTKMSHAKKQQQQQHDFLTGRFICKQNQDRPC